MSNEHAVQSTGNVAPVTTAETLIGTITIPPENQTIGDGIYLSGIVTGTTGTGVTAIAVRVRQGNGVGGAQVGNTCTTQVGASLPFTAPFAALDSTVVYAAGNTYSITAVQTAATGNGSGFNTAINSSPCSPLAG